MLKVEKNRPLAKIVAEIHSCIFLRKTRPHSHELVAEVQLKTVNLKSDRKKDIKNYYEWEIEEVMPRISGVIKIHQFESSQKASHNDWNKTENNCTDE